MQSILRVHKLFHNWHLVLVYQDQPQSVSYPKIYWSIPSIPLPRQVCERRESIAFRTFQSPQPRSLHFTCMFSFKSLTIISTTRFQEQIRQSTCNITDTILSQIYLSSTAPQVEHLTPQLQQKGSLSRNVCTITSQCKNLLLILANKKQNGSHAEKLRVYRINRLSDSCQP